MARRRRARHIEIVFETHSTTTDNERWVASGWLDGQLSPLGRRQAKELGERRATNGASVVFLRGVCILCVVLGATAGIAAVLTVLGVVLGTWIS